MKAQIIGTRRFVFLLLVLASLTACQTARLGLISASKALAGEANYIQPQQGSSQAFSVPGRDPEDNPLSMFVKIYSRPDVNSSVVGMLPPMKGIYILDSSADGAFLAITTVRNDLNRMGWISREAAVARAVPAEARSLAKVYRQPSDDSLVVNVLTPSQTANILGKSPDGYFLATIQASVDQSSISWVPVAGLQLQPRTARVNTLIRTYLKADPFSPDFALLVPGQVVEVIGQNGEGTMLAVGSSDQQAFLGWLAASYLEFTTEGFDPPVLGQ